ncbi:hypothetical protein [Wolbachia endosymbiont (group A) of Scambus nigricans]|nr:hypothetical protein [Wolbachia endosymbiont (group A) of Scambus nigricans]
MPKHNWSYMQNRSQTGMKKRSTGMTAVLRHTAAVSLDPAAV